MSNLQTGTKKDDRFISLSLHTTLCGLIISKSLLLEAHTRFVGRKKAKRVEQERPYIYIEELPLNEPKNLFLLFALNFFVVVIS